MNMKEMISWCVLAYAAQALAGGAVLSRVADAELATCGDGVAVFDDRPFQMTSAAAARLAGKTFFRRTIEGGFSAEVVKGGGTVRLLSLGFYVEILCQGGKEGITVKTVKVLHHAVVVDNL